MSKFLNLSRHYGIHHGQKGALLTNNIQLLFDTWLVRNHLVRGGPSLEMRCAITTYAIPHLCTPFADMSSVKNMTAPDRQAVFISLPHHFRTYVIICYQLRTLALHISNQPSDD